MTASVVKVDHVKCAGFRLGKYVVVLANAFLLQRGKHLCCKYFVVQDECTSLQISYCFDT